jgi:hypothetical protein
MQRTACEVVTSPLLTLLMCTTKSNLRNPSCGQLKTLVYKTQDELLLLDTAAEMASCLEFKLGRKGLNGIVANVGDESCNVPQCMVTRWSFKSHIL